MASKTSVPKTEVTWSQRMTDFRIVLESGEKINVHKHILADNSEVFDAMLTQEMKENKNNETRLGAPGQFDRETVICFIQYMYAGLVNDRKTIKRIKAGVGPEEYIYRRCFDQDKFTIALLRMADMYQVEDLKVDCAEHLKRDICDENVIEIWLGAETLKNESLSSSAMKHLVDRPTGTSFKELPGFKEAFQSSDRSLKKLVDVLGEKIAHLKAEVSNLQGEVLDLKKNNTGLLEFGKIKIIVKQTLKEPQWTEEFYFHPTEKISRILEEVDNRGFGKWRGLSTVHPYNTSRGLPLNSTFLENGITTNTTLYIWL